MTRYEIVKDPDELRKFVDWLPDLEENEKFYVTLFARKKYDPTIRNNGDKAGLHRFVSDKTRLIEKIYRLESPIGTYRIGLSGEVVNQEALALYITPNPRDLWKACFVQVKACLRMIESGNRRVNPHSEALSSIQKSASKNKKWVMFDVDSPTALDAERLTSVTGPEAVTIVSSRGGFRVYVELKKVLPRNVKTWYRNVANDVKADQIGDLLCSVNGCVQGNHVPRFLYPRR